MDKEKKEEVASVKPAPKKEFPNRGFIDQPDKYPQNAEDAENTFVDEGGEIRQIPTPVIDQDNAVAKDAPVFNE